MFRKNNTSLLYFLVFGLYPFITHINYIHLVFCMYKLETLIDIYSVRYVALDVY
jgi:hypothetical protein